VVVLLRVTRRSGLDDTPGGVLEGEENYFSSVVRRRKKKRGGKERLHCSARKNDLPSPTSKHCERKKKRGH